MPSRVIALLFAVVLLWSGLNTNEAPRGFAQPLAEQLHAGDLEAGHEGSVEHHHLDDLPWQAQSDPPTEPPGLLPMPLRGIAPRVSLGHPLYARCATAPSPFLEGPLRPPCSAGFAG